MLLSALFFFGIGAIITLDFVSTYKSRQPNAFLRKLLPHLITEYDIKDLKSQNLYIAGFAGNYVYIGNTTYKNLLYRVDSTKLQDSMIFLTAPKNFVTSQDARIVVSEDQVFLMDGIKQTVTIGSLSGFHLSQDVKTPFFTTGLPLTPNSFLLRALNNQHQNILVKLDVPKKSLAVKPDILKKQVDGFFCTDGIFIKAPHSNNVFYIYYYRNQFIATDTNLSVLYTGKTIDTVAHAKIKLGRIASDNQLTIANPPVYVNKKASANERYLFINSALKADNETIEMHEGAAAIDVYDLNNGKYKFSFYLASINVAKMTDFAVCGQTLYALFGTSLYKYKLNF